ncbi:hypothetical protein [Acaryochloris sp. CCMEE 5410]|uniref:hypothetical protein n=1 Tax=Acaryochloris sp. CCMEE 5410 TaxID=310037 RepID=UPI00024848CB|nr:hypothetical protein [Acaryochloris sp. CCMEE 5410]KAI9129826.1 hypothetical protein ON05_032400 [Acaryochloris sp. CCMEE 5410]
MNTLLHSPDPYLSILKDAAKVSWQVEDVLGAGQSLDFTQPFLPESLTRTQMLTCLSPAEQLKLNQIRGNSYLHLFGLVEEFILPLVMDYVKTIGCQDIEATQAYLGFAEQESKHIHLFRQFAEAFASGFGSPCDCIGPAKAVADFVLRHSPLGVALVTLHIEWMTQHHFLECVQDRQGTIDPLFFKLLKYHWQEEAQHARLDALMVQSMAQALDTTAIATGIDDYLTIIQYLQAGLVNQVQLDLTSLEYAIHRQLTTTEREHIKTAQATSYHQTFLLSGMTHPRFVQTVQQISPTRYGRIAELTQMFS